MTRLFGKISIKTLLQLIFSAIIISASLVYYIYTRESHLSTYKDGAALSHNSIIRYLKSGFVQSYDFNNYGLFREIYNWIENDDKIKFVVLFDRNKNKLRIIPRGYRLEAGYDSLKQLDGIFSAKLPYITRSITLKLKNEEFTMFVGFSSQDYANAEARIFGDVGKRAVFILVIGILLALVIAQSLSAPIMKLINTAKIIAGGNMQARADENSGGREFRDLAKYFNDMVNKIVDSQSRLVEEMEARSREMDSHNKILEQKNQELRSEINEKIRAETALMESERLVKAIIDTTPAALAYIGPSGNFLHVNDYWANIFGSGKDEIIGKSFSGFNPDLPAGIAALPKDGGIYGKEISISAGGAAKSFIFYVNPHYSANGELLGRVLFMADISKLKQYELELLKSREEAVIANKHKSDFLASMSHEIRTPMNAIIGFSELLQNRLKNNKNIEYLNSIVTSGRNLLKIINDILDLSKIEANKFELQIETADIRNVIFDIEQIFSIKISQKGLQLRTKIDKKIPRWLLIDESRIRQILLNIVGNSVKFTSSGYIEIDVRADKIDKKKMAADLRIDVIDSGIGIAEAELQKIFEAFHQPGDQKLKTYGGTGLGLTISKKLVEMMKGSISVESRLNHGTKFTIRLPGIGIPLDNPLAREIIAGEPGRGYNFRKAVVLVVDDIEFNRRLITEMLKSYNLSVHEAGSGEEALRLSGEIKPDLVLLDMKMPDMNGYECAQILKQLHSEKRFPIILISASTMKTDESSIYACFDDYMLKPVIKADLVRILKKYLPYDIVEKSEIDINAAANEPFFNINTVDFNVSRDSKGMQLLYNLDNRFRVAKDILRETLMLSELQAFALNIIEYGEKFGEDSIIFYGNDLLRYCDSLDFEKIMEYLNDYDALVEKLRNYMS